MERILGQSKSIWMNSIGYVGQEVYLLDEVLKKILLLVLMKIK